jgi:hypothetical protein
MIHRSTIRVVTRRAPLRRTGVTFAVPSSDFRRLWFKAFARAPGEF